MSAPEVKLAPHASEAGHWYDDKGNIVEQVPLANGKGYTKTTLAHAKRLRLYPGTTGVLRQGAESFFLKQWKLKEAIRAAQRTPRTESDEEDAWIARILEDADEKARLAREEGTAIHAVIQAHYQGKPPSPGMEHYVAGAVAVLEQRFGTEVDWTPEHGVTCRSLGFGTKADLISGCRGYIIDWKGTEGDADKLLRKQLYDDHHSQLAATRYALAEALDKRFAAARCYIGFVSRTHKDEQGRAVAALVESKPADLEWGWLRFRALHQLWCINNDYRPGLSFKVLE